MADDMIVISSNSTKVKILIIQVWDSSDGYMKCYM